MLHQRKKTKMEEYMERRNKDKRFTTDAKPEDQTPKVSADDLI